MRSGELPFGPKCCLFLKMRSDRDSLVREQLRWSDRLASIRFLEARPRTTHARLPVAPERNVQDRYTHRLGIRQRPAQEFLPVASRSRNSLHSVRKNQPVGGKEIVPGRSFRIRLATTNNQNLVCRKTGAHYLLWCAN